jgi:hypothetical protein
MAILDLQHLAQATASLEGTNDPIAHWPAGKGMFDAIELVGRFQQPALVLWRDPTITFCLDLRFDLDPESMKRRSGKDRWCSTAAPIDRVSEDAQRSIDGRNRSVFPVLAFEILDCFSLDSRRQPAARPTRP